MKNIILKTGSIAGIILGGYLAFSMYMMKGKTDFNMGGAEMFGYLSMIVILLIAMFVGVKMNNNSVPAPTLGKNILLCISIAGVASLYYLVSWALIYKFMVPDFVVRMLANMDHNYAEGKITLDDLNNAKSMLEGYDHPVKFSLLTLMEIFPLGAVLGAVLPTVLWFIPVRSKKD